MIGGTRAFGLPTPTATKQFPLGCLLYNDEGDGTIYKYVQATAASIAAGDVVSLSGGGTTVSTTPASATGVATRVGVAPYAFTASYYGFIVVHGPVLARSGTVSAGTVVVPNVASAGAVVALAPGAGYAQAEAVAAMSIIGVAGTPDSGGFATIFVRNCL